jgi:hypothetical protein
MSGVSASRLRCVESVNLHHVQLLLGRKRVKMPTKTIMGLFRLVSLFSIQQIVDGEGKSDRVQYVER